MTAGALPDAARQLVRADSRQVKGDRAGMRKALEDAGVPAAEADAIVEENEQSRLAGLRASLAVLAIFALLAFIFANGIPTRQPGAAPLSEATPEQ